MKISGALYQHLSDNIDHNALTLILWEREFFAGEQEVPESDVWDVDGRVIGFGRHDYLSLSTAMRFQRSDL
jgi:hypothetical protein